MIVKKGNFTLLKNIRRKGGGARPCLDAWLSLNTPLKSICYGNTQKTNLRELFLQSYNSKTLISVKQDSTREKIWRRTLLQKSKRLLWRFPGNIKRKMLLWSTQNQCCFNVKFGRWFNVDKVMLFRCWNTVIFSTSM